MDASQQACDLLGSALDGLSGAPIDQFLIGADEGSDNSWSDYSTRLSGEDSVTVRGQLRRDDASVIPVRLSLDLVESEGSEYVLLFAESLTADRPHRNGSEASKRRERVLEHLSVPGVLYDFSTVPESFLEAESRTTSAEEPRVLIPPNYEDHIPPGKTNGKFEDFTEAIGPSESTFNFLSALPEEETRTILRKLFSGETEFTLKTSLSTEETGEIPLNLRVMTLPGQTNHLSSVFCLLEKSSPLSEIIGQEPVTADTFEQITQKIEQVVWVFDSKLEDLLLYNGPVKKIYGCEPEAIEANSEVLLEMIHPEDRPSVQSAIDSMVNGKAIDVEYRANPHEDFSRWVWTQGVPVEDESGRVQRIVGFTKEITDRKRIESSLSETKELYRDLVSDVPGVVYRCLADESWTMRFLNDKVESITGYSREEFLGNEARSFWSIIHPDDRERVRTSVEDSIEKGEAFEVEYRITAADDEVRWLLGRGRAIDSTEDGVPILHGVLVDVTDRKRTQQKLEKSEKRYRALFEQAAVGMAYVDLEGQLLRVNDTFCELLGYDREELQRKTFQEVTHPDDLRKDLDNLESLKRGGNDQYSMEKRYVRKDGSVFWAQLTVGVVSDQDGDPEYLVSVIEDINDRKQTEEELRKSEEKFRELAENIDEVFWLTDADKNEMLYVSPNVEKFFGVKPDDFYEDADVWLEHVHPEDQSRVRKDLLERQRTGNYEEEFRVILPDGSIRWVRDRAFPIENDEGNVQRIAGIIEDITKEKRIQEEQETFFNLSLDLFALSDYEGKYLDVNPAFSEVLGYSRSELTSMPFLEFVHPEDVEETQEVMQKLEEGEPVTDFENRYITKDGDVRWLSWRAEPGEDMVYAVARDVTERRNYEERLQAMVEEKETLLKEIHHRVKNNLQMISSMLDMQMREIDREDLNDKLRDSVNRIKSMALIHENLYQSENLANLDFTRYIQELTERTLRVHHQKPERVTLDYDVDNDPIDLDNAIPCGLVLNELLTNALEHGYKGQEEGTITVTFKNQGRRAKLTVRDDGRGFDPDFDLDETDTFGMQIVRSLVEYELDGQVSVRNDGGAVVDISFPL